MEDAASDEKAGDPESAISRYLQAADILLLLAKVEEHYPTWKYYTDTAARCQQTARRLIALAPREGVPSSPSPCPAEKTPPS